MADDIAAGGVSAELVDAWPGDPVADALPLRLTGALHALVLAAAAPALVACYPPRTTMITEQLRPVLLSAIVEHKDYIRTFLKSPPQTNEVGRSAVLLGGFLTIAKETGLPLRILEIGASAGLNTLWDKYHFRLGVADWGDRRSAVQIGSDWQGVLPPLEAPLRVIERRACDMAPVDLEDAAQRLRLRAYIWADQHERLERLEAAIAVTRAIGQRVERADAASWVRARLKELAKASVTVLYHSIMWQYLPAQTQADIAASLQQAGGQATETSPLAWLRFEPRHLESRRELRLTLWPTGQEFCLAVAHPQWKTWCG